MEEQFIAIPNREMARMWASEAAFYRWRIKEPPPWLLCWLLGVPYRIGEAF